jgi:predicted DNA-binding protein (UPF0251 family)/predicted Fe-Mo cluster-binding NifX family protein
MSKKERGFTMGRMKRCRFVESYPQWNSFGPEGMSQAETAVLTVEEFETIRLIDWEHLTQQECAERMHVARTTVTDIYDHARLVLADCLVNGKNLVVAGGRYELKRSPLYPEALLLKKGSDVMRVAIPCEEGEVFQHFGKTEQFKVYDIENGAVVSSTLLPTNGQGHGALSGFLKGAHVDVVLCGGIGGGARQALNAENIQFFPGVTGSCDDAAAAYAAGKLEYSNEAPSCGHHDHACGHHHNGCGHHEQGGCHA